jgi:predicted deacylase
LSFEKRWVHSNPVDYRSITSCYVPEIPRGGSGHPLISYQIATTFYKEILSKAQYRLNLHGGDIELNVLESVMYSRSGLDEERDNENLALARNFGWEWIREGLPRARPKGVAAPPRLEMPMTVGTEAGSGMGRCTSDDVDRVFKGLINAMRYLKMLDGTPEIPPTAKVFNPYHMYSKRGGFFISNVVAGDIVKEGQILGVIKNLSGEVLEEIVVPTDGVVHMVTSPAIYEGDAVYEIGKDIREIK